MTVKYRRCLRATAVHESGQFVAGALLGLEVGELRVELSQAESYCCVANPLVGWQWGDGDRRKLALRHALSLYAGAAAETLVLGACAPWYEDFDTAAHWLAQHAPPRGAEFVGDEAHERQEARLRAKTERLLAPHVGAVSALAEELLDKRRLSRIQAHQVFTASRGW